jgi:hypothetical protein
MAGTQACDLWLWDGAAEYEGVLVKLEDAAFAARVRQVRKGAPGGTLGRRISAAPMELQKLFARRKFLAHIRGALDGTLVEASVDSVQGSGDGSFDLLLAGRFAALDERQLGLLRTLSVQSAVALFQRDAS